MSRIRRASPLLRRSLCAGLLLAAWLTAFFYVRTWDLPSRLEHVPDAIVADAAFTPAEAMQASTYSYPPLQYLLTSLALPDPSVEQCDSVAEATHRILVRRAFSSAMAFGLILLTFLFGVRHLRMNDWFAWGAAQLFALLPLVLFYSQTSNMDAPYAFWLMAAVFCVAEAELRAEGRRSVALHLAAGVFLGASFCTKDQVYAVCILPAFAYALFRLRRGESFRSATRPLLLWAASFVLTVGAIYAWAGGIPVMRAHFSWIAGGGRTEFFQAGDSFAERLSLLRLQVRSLLCAADLPLLAALLAGALLLRSGWRSFLREEWLFPVAILLAMASMQLFLIQILRASHARYAVVFLPFLALLAFRMLERARPRPLVVAVIAVLLGYSGLNAASFLSGMKRTPRQEAVSVLKKNPETFAAMTLPGERFLYGADGAATRYGAYRSWLFAKLEPEGDVPDLALESFFFHMKDPDSVLLSGDVESPFADELKACGAYRTERAFRRKTILPTLFVPPIGEYELLRRDRSAPLPSAKDFAERSLSRQIMALEALNRCGGGCDDPEKLAWIGRSLRPFREDEIGRILISRSGIGFLMRCYEAGGRDADAARVAAFLGLPAKTEDAERDSDAGLESARSPSSF